MKTWEALAKMSAARDGVENHEDLEESARQTLRTIGMSDEEIDDDFPDIVVEHGIQMMFRNPKEFSRRCKNAREFMVARN